MTGEVEHVELKVVILNRLVWKWNLFDNYDVIIQQRKVGYTLDLAEWQILSKCKPLTTNEFSENSHMAEKNVLYNHAKSSKNNQSRFEEDTNSFLDNNLGLFWD